MRIFEFPDFKSAVFKSTKPDKKYMQEWHPLKKGQKIRWHYHRKADEIVIIDNGVIVVASGGEMRIISLEGSGTAVAIHFLKGQPHALFAFTSVVYMVYKTCADVMVSCQGPKLSAEVEREAKLHVLARSFSAEAVAKEPLHIPRMGGYISPQSACCGAQIVFTDGGVRRKICSQCKNPIVHPRFK